MRFPVENFETNWNTTSGYGFGAKTGYGFHEGIDINDNGGGDSDFGKPLYAICDGIVTSVHTHNSGANFGKHLHIRIEGPWGTKWVHYAHCRTIFVVEGQSVKEGQLIAEVGKTGTVYAHVHFAIKNQPTGIDGIAKTLADLKKWDDPIPFINQWMNTTQPLDQDRARGLNVLEEHRKVRIEGPEGNFEAYIRELVSRDQKFSSLVKDLMIAEKISRDKENKINELMSNPTPSSLFAIPLSDLLRELGKRLLGK